MVCYSKEIFSLVTLEKNIISTFAAFKSVRRLIVSKMFERGRSDENSSNCSNICYTEKSRRMMTDAR